MPNHEVWYLVGVVSVIGFTFGVATAFSSTARIRTIDDVDWGTRRECRRYANDHPERSIPIERQRWFDQQGYDYKNYDYYADCLRQKVPIDGLNTYE